jgi:hypothetical protein
MREKDNFKPMYSFIFAPYPQMFSDDKTFRYFAYFASYVVLSTSPKQSSYVGWTWRS